MYNLNIIKKNTYEPIGKKRTKDKKWKLKWPINTNTNKWPINT